MGAAAIPASVKRRLSLPLFPGMTDEDVEHVVATVREAIGAA